MTCRSKLMEWQSLTWKAVNLISTSLPAGAGYFRQLQLLKSTGTASVTARQLVTLTNSLEEFQS